MLRLHIARGDYLRHTQGALAFLVFDLVGNYSIVLAIGGVSK